MDDIGTGYSALRYLRPVLADIVKIDQDFVADMGRAPSASTTVAAVVHVAHDLGERVTAEGVESAVQRDDIISAGCELAQGLFFAHSMNARDLATHLACPGPSCPDPERGENPPGQRRAPGPELTT